MPDGCSLAWNADFEVLPVSGGWWLVLPVSAVRRGGGGGTGRLVWWVVSCGALLGPEGAGAFL
jgi:hypothetical protein